MCCTKGTDVLLSCNDDDGVDDDFAVDVDVINFFINDAIIAIDNSHYLYFHTGILSILPYITITIIITITTNLLVINYYHRCHH